MPPGDPCDSITQVVVLGCTGSIGRSALDVIARANRPLAVHSLGARSNWEIVAEQARATKPRFVALADAEAATQLRQALSGLPIEVFAGPDGLESLAAHPDADRVLSAVVGAAGLRGTWAALEAGKLVALANKESMVVAGPLVMDLARRRNATVIPVDSEHSAIDQCLRSGDRGSVKRVVLTSSGGPFRGKSRRELADVTPEQALQHPTWRMGPKITIDSATLMNKALEVIEARWLFGLDPDQIEVVVHPESIVHSMVEFTDGSVIAQLSPPDMRLPIQYALTYPDRVEGPAPRLELSRALALHFEPPDRETFPCLDLGFEVMRRGGTAGAVLNAANEGAVERFLAGQLRFLDIPRACRAALDHHTFDPRPSLDDLWKVDAWARREVARWNP
ncbi:MAG: 1-deoxy-D-xylulose-5-phosphate reductoisomerase [Isosphaeraceae bacterium]